MNLTLGFCLQNVFKEDIKKKTVLKCKTVADESGHLSPAQLLTNQKGE